MVVCIIVVSKVLVGLVMFGIPEIVWFCSFKLGIVTTVLSLVLAVGLFSIVLFVVN